MRPSTVRLGFLATRVGRQTLAQFLKAAMLPVLLVSVGGVWYIRRSLETSAIERVERTAKSAALMLLAELSAARDHRDTRQEGQTYASEKFTDDERSHLANGGTLLRIGASTADTRATRDAEVSFLRSTGDGTLSVTRVPPEALWLALDEVVAGENTHACVFVTGSWQRVYCGASASEETVADLRRVAMAASATPGAQVASHLLAAHRDLYLRFEFGSAEWRLAVAEVRSEALSPATTVTRSLVLVVFLALVTAFTLAHRQIRRSTIPLEALRDATRRVAEGDLHTPVMISSRDEYGELGVAFNGMTTALSGQIALLHRMDAIDESSLRERRVEAIARVALMGLHGSAPGARITIDVLDEHSTSAITAWSLGADGARHEVVATHMTESTRQQLLANPRQYVHHGVVLPLLHDRELLGAITVRGDDTIATTVVDAARRLADRVALGIANVRLLDRLDEFSSGTMLAFARAIDANSPWTAGHSERVTHLALLLGHQLELTTGEMATLHRGGLMHDVGKIGIPAAVLDKAGKLDPAERAIIERHPEIGERIVKPIPALADALPIVRSHHERFDGQGYPDKLAGTAIPWLARVLAVADVYDALVSDRPYRASLSPQAAVAMIESNSGTQFDPVVVNALIAIQNAPGMFSSPTAQPSVPAADGTLVTPTSSLTAV